VLRCLRSHGELTYVNGNARCQIKFCLCKSIRACIKRSFISPIVPYFGISMRQNWLVGVLLPKHHPHWQDLVEFPRIINLYAHRRSLGHLPTVTSPRISVSTKPEALSYVENLLSCSRLAVDSGGTLTVGSTKLIITITNITFNVFNPHCHVSQWTCQTQFTIHI
jgi:hypothetical protein